MKTALTILILSILGCIGSVCAGIYLWYSYSINAGQYLALADDASTAVAKLKYLEQYKKTVQSIIHRNHARYIFKQKQYTKEAQLQIVDTLISRLENTSQMDTKSFEYQQAMAQITGQEFDHVLSRINSVFKGCYRRQSFFLFFWLCWMSWISGISFIVSGFYILFELC